LLAMAEFQSQLMHRMYRRHREQAQLLQGSSDPNRFY